MTWRRSAERMWGLLLLLLICLREDRTLCCISYIWTDVMVSRLTSTVNASPDDPPLKPLTVIWEGFKLAWTRTAVPRPRRESRPFVELSGGGGQRSGSVCREPGWLNAERWSNVNEYFIISCYRKHVTSPLFATFLLCAGLLTLLTEASWLDSRMIWSSEHPGVVAEPY